MKWVYGAIGAVVLFWLATTSAAPAVVAILVVALLYQWGQLGSAQPKGA